MTVNSLGSAADVAQVCESAGLTRSAAGDEWTDETVIVWVAVHDHSGRTRRVCVYRHPVRAEPGHDFVAEISPDMSPTFLLTAIADARGQEPTLVVTPSASLLAVEIAARNLFRAICHEHDERGETFPVRVSLCMDGLREALGEEYPPMTREAT